MKTTALTEKHIALGAKMVPYAGFNMPVQYSGLNDEHRAVRESAGLFDVSHMGEFWVTGDKALELIQKISSNDASKLSDGKIQYSCLPNDVGGIVDDLLIYRFDAERYLLVVNAGNIDKDWQWIARYNTMGAEVENRSEQTSLLAVQGPKATAILQKLTSEDLSAIPYYSFKQAELAGVPDVIISATGYTGSGGFELYFDNEHAEKIWDAIMEAGREEGIKPAGLGARDTLRLEMGFCLYGNDIDETTSPIQAGLGWITKFNKEFINSQELKAEKEAGPVIKLIGFEMVDRGIPRKDYEIVTAHGTPVGRVTSGTQSPSLGKAIGMGYVETKYATPDSQIFISIRGKLLRATVVKPPFYKANV